MSYISHMQTLKKLKQTEGKTSKRRKPPEHKPITITKAAHIKADFFALKKKGYTTKAVVARLAKQYYLSTARIEFYVYKKDI